MLSPNTILQNRYRVVRELGHGGMGAVYEAIDQRVSTVVALKETLLGQNSEARRAFEREAALLANLRHPGLPKVMDYFSEGEGEFLVMEFIPGYDLAELMELRGGPFPEAKVLAWAEELLKLLEYLHSRQPPIIHRDIKPSNLKVTKSGEVFLLDFGLAKGAAGQMSTLMSEKSVVGYTPVYAPLEQIHGRGTDPRSDLYAVGATLYHLLTGQQPVAAPARYGAIEDDEADPLRPPHELNSQISPELSNVIMQSMAVSRRQRQASAAEVRGALRQATADRQRDEERRRMQEADTMRRSEEQRAAEEAKRKAAEELAQAERRRKEEEQKRPMPTRHAEEDRPGAEEQKARPKTIATPFTPQPAPKFAPNPTATDPIRPAETISSFDSSTPKKLNRAMLAFMIVIAVVFIGGGVYWMAFRDSGLQTNSAAPPGAPATQPQAQSVPAPAGMVYVPGGEFMMGLDHGDDYERPAHKVSVGAFFLDETEVTCGEYKKFLRATGRAAPNSWTLGYCVEDQAPATGITWDDASAFAKWALKRLPTEEEWEFAARGTDGRRYPWGNDWKTGLANIEKSNGGIANVHAFVGKSPFGAYDMVGNAWEWTASELTTYPGGQLPIKPTSDLRVIRGGAYDSDRNTATTTYRRGYPARGNYDYSKLGFRCAKDVR